jgi:hypothetical protein
MRVELRLATFGLFALGCASDPAPPAAAPVAAPAAKSCPEAAVADAALPEGKEAKARALIAYMPTQQVMSTMLDQYRQALHGLIPEELWEAFRRDFSAKLVERLAVPIYVEKFTDAELAAMLRFYRSPEGSSVMAKMPQVMAESMKQGAEWGSLINEAAVNDWLAKQQTAAAKP